MYTEKLQEELFKRRFHGSVNIKGIDFQILYALYTALDLLATENKLEKLTLEGIEDIDLKPFQADNIYLQVKTSINSWHLYEIAPVLINFIRLNTESNNLQKFELILDFKPRQSIENLFSKKTSIEEKEKLIKDILKLTEIKKHKVTHKQITDVILNSELKNIDKQELTSKIKIKISNLLNIHPSEIEYYLLSLLYKFIDWSIKRKTINAQDLINFKVKYSENKQRSLEFEAYGKGLIDRVSWKDESQPYDYIEGKKTRFGHIALGLDVVRPKWLQKIDEVYKKVNVCVIREASGQGKSTLAFRYAHNNWNSEYTFSIKIIETLEQAEQISNYLKAVSELGLMPTVIIDDVNSERRYFSNILQNCASHKIYFLVTSRNDDYYSFCNIGQVSLEFINPYFDRVEAKLIFQNLKKENKIHANTISSDWAFEKIASPKCLIEFIFLITQGEMLHERLQQQIKSLHLSKQNEKIEFIRKAIIADLCHTPLNINQLAFNKGYNVNFQEIIDSINNEFIVLENNFIKGYHWVRSSHLLKILHENYTNPAITALKTIPLIEEDKVDVFIGNLTEVVDFDVDILINNYKYISNEIDIYKYFSIVFGIFKIGEYQFYVANKDIYDEGYKEYNEGFLFLFNIKSLPTVSQDLFGVFGDNENFIKAGILSNKTSKVSRGFDLVKLFIETNEFNFEINTNNITILGKVLDWSFWANINLLSEDKVNILTENESVFNLDIKSFSLISQALFRKHPDIHANWFQKHRNEIVLKLEHHLKCNIKLSDRSAEITYSFFNKGENMNDATVKRLEILRSAIPFVDNYKGQYVSETQPNIAESTYMNIAYDKSFKNMPRENLPYDSDVEKNRVLYDIVENKYRVKTWYEFCECYYLLRKEIYNYSRDLCSYLGGNNINFKTRNAPYIHELILHSYKKMPIEVSGLKDGFKGCTDAFDSYSKFLTVKSNFVQNQFDENLKRLIFYNYNKFLVEFPKMQSFFRALKDYCPVYFRFEELDSKEESIFTLLNGLLRVVIPDSKPYWDIDDILFN